MKIFSVLFKKNTSVDWLKGELIKLGLRETDSGIMCFHHDFRFDGSSCKYQGVSYGCVDICLDQSRQDSKSIIQSIRLLSPQVVYIR